MEQDRRVKFGAQLKQRRTIKGFSQSEVAKAAKIPQSRLSVIEKGVGSIPSIALLWKILDAIGCDLIIVEKPERMRQPIKETGEDTY